MITVRYEFDVTPEHAEHANRLVQIAGGVTRFEQRPEGNFNVEGKIEIDSVEDLKNLKGLEDVVRWYNADLTVKRQAARDTDEDLNG
jgi:hypothetical protein